MAASLLDELPVAPPATLGPFRDADYQALADEPRCELLYGELVVTPAPSQLHQIVLGCLGRRLEEIADQVGGVLFLAPLDVRLFEHSVVQPDLAFVGPDRLGRLANRLEGAPSLAVEVVSRSSARRDRLWKLRLYAEAGVPEYWIVDGSERTIDFLVLTPAGRYEIGLPDGGVWRSPTAPALELDVERFWRDVDAVLARLPR